MQPRLKTLLKRLGWAVLALLGLGAVLFYDQLRHGGQFRDLPPATPLACDAVPLPGSAEDIQLDRPRRLAYLSVLDRRGRIEGRDVEGDIMRLDLSAPGATPVSALAAKPPGFKPHGISLYRTGDGKLRLFVISHIPGGSHAVEVFEQRADGQFRPVRTVRDPLLRSPNALVAVGPDQFYVANDSGARNALQRFAEIALRRPLSGIDYFDGETMRVAAGDLASVAGLGLSPDGTRLYAAETVGKRLTVFARNPGTAELVKSAEVAVDGAPDNVSVDLDGTVWLAVHGRTLDLVRHFADARHPAPSWIQRWSPAAPAKGLQTAFLDDGRRLSAGSVGAVLDRQLLVGSITEPKVLSCRLP